MSICFINQGDGFIDYIPGEIELERRVNYIGLYNQGKTTSTCFHGTIKRDEASYAHRLCPDEQALDRRF